MIGVLDIQAALISDHVKAKSRLIKTRRTGFGRKCNCGWASTNYDQIIHSVYDSEDTRFSVFRADMASTRFLVLRMDSTQLGD